MDEVPVDLFGSVVLLLGRLVLIFLHFYVVLVDGDQLGVPFFWVEVVYDSEDLRAELLV